MTYNDLAQHIGKSSTTGDSPKAQSDEVSRRENFCLIPSCVRTDLLGTKRKEQNHWLEDPATPKRGGRPLETISRDQGETTRELTRVSTSTLPHTVRTASKDSQEARVFCAELMCQSIVRCHLLGHLHNEARHATSRQITKLVAANPCHKCQRATTERQSVRACNRPEPNRFMISSDIVMDTSLTFLVMSSSTQMKMRKPHWMRSTRSVMLCESTSFMNLILPYIRHPHMGYNLPQLSANTFMDICSNTPSWISLPHCIALLQPEHPGYHKRISTFVDLISQGHVGAMHIQVNLFIICITC